MAKKNTVKKPTAKKPTRKVKDVAPVVEETQEATTTEEATNDVEDVETIDKVEETSDTTEEAQETEEKATTEASKDETLDDSKGQMIEVVVTAEKFGTHKKGDILTMHVSTAKACSKAVKVKK